MNRAVFLAAGWSQAKPDFLWLPMERKFKARGFDVIRADCPYNGLAPIQYSVHCMEEVIHAIRPEFDHITFIGHSMGGLLGRYAIGNKKLPFDSYVSIGSPHRGAPLAKLGSFFSASAAQMAPGSRFLNDLKPLDVPSLAIQGRKDLLVPIYSASVDFGENIQINAGHIGLLLHPRTFDEIWAFLTYGVFDETGLFSNDKAASTKMKT